jgi:hypothetical protein
MLIYDFPRWAVWLMNLAVIAILSVLVFVLKWVGPEFAAGCGVGFFFCYIVNGCWNRDIEAEAKERLLQSRQQPPLR